VGNPDTASTAVGRETEGSVRTPVSGGLLEDHVLGDGLEVWCGNTLPKPFTLHLNTAKSVISSTNQKNK